MARPVLTEDQITTLEEAIGDRMSDQWLAFRDWIERSHEVKAIIGERNQDLLNGEEFIWEPLQDMFSTPDKVTKKLLARLRAAEKYWRV